MSNGIRSFNFSNILVLVAEHNNYMRQTIRSILRTFNIGDIIETQNPDDAWDMFCATPPDVVFADWAPGFDGMGLLQKIRRDPKSPNPFVPIIIVTSMSDKKNVLTSRDLGMTEFLAKPFSPKQIFLRLRIVASTLRLYQDGQFLWPRPSSPKPWCPKE
jgi:two-component system chemotaxis response regulator CheY